MWKRMIAGLLIAVCVISFSNFSYANVDATKYEILKPEKLSYSTQDKVILINGKAPSGTEIKIDVYGTTDLTKKNFNLDKLPSEKDYILVLNDKVTSGNMGFFQKQLDLVNGINKLIINFGVEGVESKEIIVYVYDRVRARGTIVNTRDARLTDILPLLR